MSKIKDALKRAKQERAEPHSVHSVKATGRTDTAAEEESRNALTKVIPYTENAVVKHKVITPYYQNNDLVERFKLLRTVLLSRAQIDKDKVFLITSTLAREGKTFVSVNLATTFAREVDQTVLLMDLNFKNPSVLGCFGIEAQEGLTDYLLHDAPLSQVLIRPGIDKLVILPPGRPVDNSAELLRSHKMQNLMQEIKDRYTDRYIFVDAPALLSCVDSIVLSSYTDKTLFVLASGTVSPEKVSEALGLMDKEKVLGTVLNRRNILSL